VVTVLWRVFRIKAPPIVRHHNLDQALRLLEEDGDFSGLGVALGVQERLLYHPQDLLQVARRQVQGFR
jgi:hypothetical protein